MRRYRKALAVAVLGFALLLYREWVIRSKPPVFLPLGFFEAATAVQSPEDEARNEASWVDPVRPTILEDEALSELSIRMNADEQSFGIVVIGPTLGGFAAALASGSEGVPTLLVAEDDWNTAMRSEAAYFMLHHDRQLTPSEGLERDLMRHIQITEERIAAGTRDDLLHAVVTFFANRAAETPSLHVLNNHTLVAFGRDDHGSLNRALFQSTNGSGAVLARFDYLVDSTRDGKIMALAGVPTVSSWNDDADTAEIDSLPLPALSALSRGYTLSGRTIPGIGKRLSNAYAYAEIEDRGFNGSFTPITERETCWTSDTRAESFMASGSTVFSTHAIGCTARASVHASFEDTVEIFFVNHGNDAVEATVRTAGTTLNIRMNVDPNETMVRIGAFPVGPESPITIDFHSVLPTDRIEGVISRKLNMNSSTAYVGLLANNETVVTANSWQNTEYDAYFMTTDDGDGSTLYVDGDAHELSPAGKETYVAKGILLSNGKHTVQHASAGMLVLIPIRPGMSVLPVTKTTNHPIHDIDKNSIGWSIRPEENIDAVITIPTEACTSECTYKMIEESTSRVVLEARPESTNVSIATDVPVGKASLQADETYVFVAQGEYDERIAPSIVPMKNSSYLYSIGTGGAHVEPTRAGMVYDVWVRPVRPSRSVVTIGNTERTLKPSDHWQYALTEPLPLTGVNVLAGGTVEIIAIPNVLLDSYLIPVNAAQGPPAHVFELPPATYSVASYGAQNPIAVTSKDSNGTVQLLTFMDGPGFFESAAPYVHTTDVTLTSASAWPQRLVLYERILQPDDIVPITDAIIRTTSSLAGPHASRGSQGLLLFEPRPTEGIGPVTIGTLNGIPEKKRMDSHIANAVLLLRMGRSNVQLTTCSAGDDPRCDARRYVRHLASSGGTVELDVSATHPEGRRLRGNSTLSASGAYADRKKCLSCAERCIIPTMSGSTCVYKNGFEPPIDTILSVRGISGAGHIVSPRESLLGTLPMLLKTLRRDRLISGTTYFETVGYPRDVFLTLGMLLASGHENVLPGSTTISATHRAAKAIHTPSAEIAIGNAVGHIASFSLRHEFAPLKLIEKSPDAIARLQEHLIRVGVPVVPVEGKDALETKAIQQRILEGRTNLVPAWKKDRVVLEPTPLTPDERSIIFKGEAVHTVGEALLRLPHLPADQSLRKLLDFGLENGFLNENIANMAPHEIMALELDDSLLLKAEYLFRAQD